MHVHWTWVVMNPLQFRDWLAFPQLRLLGEHSSKHSRFSLEAIFACDYSYNSYAYTTINASLCLCPCLCSMPFAARHSLCLLQLDRLCIATLQLNTAPIQHMSNSTVPLLFIAVDSGNGSWASLKFINVLTNQTFRLPWYWCVGSAA